ncbi:hypothetical protein KCP71_21640 [Salmonella enterica subsp. enterica]|nr:hypothetical protein KCP71_21640 [Salmonella enterica subsp. enterica]
MERVGLFCCTTMDLTPRYSLSLRPQGKTYTRFKLANTANGFWLLRFIRGSSPGAMSPRTPAVFRIMHRNYRQARMISLQPSIAANRFRRVFVYLNRLIRPAVLQPLVGTDGAKTIRCVNWVNGFPQRWHSSDTATTASPVKTADADLSIANDMEHSHHCHTDYRFGNALNLIGV